VIAEEVQDLARESERLREREYSPSDRSTHEARRSRGLGEQGGVFGQAVATSAEVVRALAIRPSRESALPATV